MAQRILLTAGLIAGLGMAQAFAQAGSGASTPVTPPAPASSGPNVARVPTLGDTGNVPRRVARRNNRSDRPAPSSQNGNQPDRASAGAGAR